MSECRLGLVPASSEALPEAKLAWLGVMQPKKYKQRTVDFHNHRTVILPCTYLAIHRQTHNKPPHVQPECLSFSVRVMYGRSCLCNYIRICSFMQEINFKILETYICENKFLNFLQLQCPPEVSKF